MFEKVNKAYEFLCTKSTKIVDGPDPENIILILKTQSILFNRHKEGKSSVMIDRGLFSSSPYWVTCFATYSNRFGTVITKDSGNFRFGIRKAVVFQRKGSSGVCCLWVSRSHYSFSMMLLLCGATWLGLCFTI